MNRVLISGYYGFANAGDEAMLTAIIGALKKNRPDTEIVVISGQPRETTKWHGVKSISRLNGLAIIWQLLKTDLLISGGGSLLQDVTSKRSLYYYLSIIVMAKLFLKKVILYGHGIGPINANLARTVTKHVCNCVDRITVRDTGSKEELESLGVTQNITVTSDPVFAINPVPKDIGRKILDKYGVHTKAIIGVSIRKWRGLSNYQNILASVCDEIINKYDVAIVFVPLQYPEDVLACEEITSKMKNKKQAIIMKECYTTTEFMSIVGNFELLIGVRLHALIFAAVMGVPVIGLSYDPKIDRFLLGIQTKAIGTLDTIDEQTLLKKIISIYDNLSEERRLQAKSVENLRKKAVLNAQFATELL